MKEVSWTFTKKLDTFADPGDIKRREVSWTLTKKLDSFADPGEIKRREVTWTFTKLDSFAGPGEIKRREVSWTLTKKLDFHLRVQARPRGGRWCWTLKRAQERSRAGRWSWAQKVGLLLLQLFLNSSATDIVLVTLLHTAVEQQLRGTLAATQWRGDMP